MWCSVSITATPVPQITRGEPLRCSILLEDDRGRRSSALPPRSRCAARLPPRAHGLRETHLRIQLPLLSLLNGTASRMTFIPSIRLSENLALASIGLWPEAVADGRAVLVCKMPETAIKALHMGAQCSFFVAVVQAEPLDLLCLGFRVNDEPENPFTALMLNASPEDVPLLLQILTADSTALHCLNELNHPMLSAWCSMDRGAAAAAADALSASNYWLLTLQSSEQHDVSTVSRLYELALDRFGKHVYRSPSDAVADEIKMTADLPLTLDIWPQTEVFEVTPTNADGPFVISDHDEGKKFERLTKLLIDVAYPGGSYLSPRVQDGKSTRELEDVLAFDERSICVVEAKALSVLNVQRDRPSTRRAANVTKGIEKAISQLSGAMANIRSDATIFTVEGQPLTVPNRKEAPAHAIVVVSEMYAFVDWKQIAARLVTESENESRKALFHVMDLQELSALTSRCPDSWTFFERLAQRWVHVKLKGTSYMRTKVILDAERLLRQHASMKTFTSWYFKRVRRPARSTVRVATCFPPR